MACLALLKKLEHRIEKLEKENEKLKKWVFREKKKCKVEDWLNDCYIANQSLDSWISNIVVTCDDIDLVHRYGVAVGTYYIIQRNLPFEQRRNFPIFCFQGHRHIFFAFKEDIWLRIGDEEIMDIIKKINNKLLIVLTKEYTPARPHFINSPSGRAQWSKLLRKIILDPVKSHRVLQQFKKRLFQYLKFNIKKVIDYELEF